VLLVLSSASIASDCFEDEVIKGFAVKLPGKRNIGDSVTGRITTPTRRPWRGSCVTLRIEAS
jgi:hypothetical protein